MKVPYCISEVANTAHRSKQEKQQRFCPLVPMPEYLVVATAAEFMYSMYETKTSSPMYSTRVQSR